MKVRIVQLLCPQRHCVLATAYQSPDGRPILEMAARLRESFDEWVNRGANPWCGLCQSRELRCEDAATRFETMEQAMPFLRENERREAATREYFRASRG